MNRRLAVSLLSVFIILAATQPVLASSPQLAAGTTSGPSGPVDWAAYGASVRMPESAADWASFTPAQRAAASAWIAQEFVALEQKGLLNTRVVEGQATTTTGTASGTYPGHCGFVVNSFPGGTWTSAYAYTNYGQSLYAISTGIPYFIGDPSYDLFYRDGSLLYSFGAGHAGPGTPTYIEASTPSNFKYFFEHALYAVESWHSAMTTPSQYVVGPGAYCYLTVAP